MDHTKRIHRAAIKAGAPVVPPGYWWSEPTERDSFNLCRQIDSDVPGAMKLRYIGELDKDGNWTPINGEQFNPLNPKPSARKSDRTKTAEFRVKVPEVLEAPVELPERSGSHPVKPKRLRPLKPSPERSGSPYQLPEIPNVQWEWNKRGGAEAYYVPNGATKRSEKTYLVYVGLRKLEKWHQAGQAELDRNVLSAVKTARSEKNL